MIENFKSEKEEKDTLHEHDGKLYLTEGKIRIPAYVDERSDVYEIEGEHTIYHLALENDDYYKNYGILANGLLVESCSKRFLKELSYMNLK